MLRMLLSLIVCCLPLAAQADDWPQFRGPNGSGLASDGQQLPDTWDVESGKNIAWTKELPGKGLSAPIVVDGKVFVTACSGPKQERLHLLCFDAKSGEQEWRRQFWATGRTMCHRKMSVAAPSPCSDGERVYAFFSTNDVFCLDLEGRLQWLRGLTFDYPNASNSLGMASSPLVVNDTLVVQVENDSQSLAFGLNAFDGQTRWKLDRPRMANWSSPAVLDTQGDAPKAVLLQSREGLAAYNALSGEPLWEYPESCSTIPSAVVSEGTVYVPSNGLTALKPGASASPESLWKQPSLGPSTPSPVVHKGRIYTINRSGVLKCASAKTGELIYQMRLDGAFSGTPSIADDKLYIFSEEGLGQVVDISAKDIPTKKRILGESPMEETILCTAAIADKALFIRSDNHLWKIAQE